MKLVLVVLVFAILVILDSIGWYCVVPILKFYSIDLKFVIYSGNEVCGNTKYIARKFLLLLRLCISLAVDACASSNMYSALHIRFSSYEMSPMYLMTGGNLIFWEEILGSVEFLTH